MLSNKRNCISPIVLVTRSKKKVGITDKSDEDLAEDKSDDADIITMITNQNGSLFARKKNEHKF